MSENNQSTTRQSNESNDRVGDILRKERITRRIAVETIAKDLKLNVNYIKALESSDYNTLPADPYVRVYLRSLAKYLSLDPEAILSTFYKERGLESDLHVQTSSKINISMNDSEEKQNPTFIIAIVLIVIIAAFAFVANRNGWVTPDQHYQETTLEQPDTTVSPDTVSLTPISVEDTTETTSEESSAENEKKPMTLNLSSKRDSVWVQVFSDGQSWKNFVRKDAPRSFTALDSFNIHAGDLSQLEVTHNGKPLKIKGSGVVTFRVDRTSHSVWSLSKWNRVFKDRL